VVAEVVVMPKLGLTMESGELVAWLKDVGEAITVGERLCEVETDKLTVEVESPAAGVLLARIEPAPGIPVGAPVAVVGAPGEDVSAISLFGPSPAQVGKSAGPLPAGSVQPQAPLRKTLTAVAPSSPAARRRAMELGIDVTRVQGTGPGGRVTLADIEAAARDSTSMSPGESVPDPPSRLRRATAEAMSISAGIPQFRLERDVDVTSLLERLAAQAAPRPTIADAVIVAVARALTRHPAFLRSWDGGDIRQRDRVNIGVAVALDEGLVVPVLADADQLDIAGVAGARRLLQQQAKEGRVVSSAPAVFTVSNLGPFGVDRFTALVNPPESGILAIGRVHAHDAGREVTLTLSADHRVVDGLDGARLLADVAEALEEGNQ
jgi:pyruvate dehydrogenase E2 component (dihydrolipoamide acetyltransferase)